MVEPLQQIYGVARLLLPTKTRVLLSLLSSSQKACNPKYDPKCTPELTKDEALCQYGQSGGKDRSEACKRAREARAAKGK